MPNSSAHPLARQRVASAISRVGVRTPLPFHGYNPAIVQFPLQQSLEDLLIRAIRGLDGTQYGLFKRAVYDYRNNAHLQIIHAFQHREKFVAL